MTFPTKGLHLHTTYVNLIFAQPNLQEAFDTEQAQNLVAHLHFGTMETNLTPRRALQTSNFHYGLGYGTVRG